MPNQKKKRKQGHLLLTIPELTEPYKALNTLLSKADSRHDFDFSIQANAYLTQILNRLYGQSILIRPGLSYTDYPPNRDPFTQYVEQKINLYQLTTTTDQGYFDPNPFGSHQILTGHVPTRAKYFMRKLEGGFLLGAAKVVVVSDNESISSLLRSVNVFLNNVNSQPRPLNITEAITLSSICDAASRSVPLNWAHLFDIWWSECVDDTDNFTIDLQAMGAVAIPAVLNISRTPVGSRTPITNILTVQLNIQGTLIDVKFNLNEPSIGKSMIKDPAGAFIFFSGKKIAYEFFRGYNILVQSKSEFKSQNFISKQFDTFKKDLAKVIASTANVNLQKATFALNSLISRLNNDFDLMAIIFLVAKLIGDLLCPLCCHDLWYTITTDKPLVARCFLLMKRVLLRYKRGLHGTKTYMDGFLFGKPEVSNHDPDPQLSITRRNNRLKKLIS